MSAIWVSVFLYVFDLSWFIFFFPSGTNLEILKGFLKHRDNIYGINVTQLCMLLVELFGSSGSLLAVFPNSKIAVLINSRILVLSSSMAVLLPNVSQATAKEKKEFGALWPAITRLLFTFSLCRLSFCISIYMGNSEHLA